MKKLLLLAVLVVGGNVQGDCNLQRCVFGANITVRNETQQEISVAISAPAQCCMPNPGYKLAPGTTDYWPLQKAKNVTVKFTYPNKRSESVSNVDLGGKFRIFKDGNDYRYASY